MSRFLELGAPSFRDGASVKAFLDSVPKFPSLGKEGDGAKRAYKNVLVGAILARHVGNTVAILKGAAVADPTVMMVMMMMMVMMVTAMDEAALLERLQLVALGLGNPVQVLVAIGAAGTEGLEAIRKNVRGGWT